MRPLLALGGWLVLAWTTSAASSDLPQPLPDNLIAVVVDG